LERAALGTGAAVPPAQVWAGRQAVPAAEVLPSGQNWPGSAVQGPLQALLCSPEAEPKVPAGHLVGFMEPEGQKEPGGQGARGLQARVSLPHTTALPAGQKKPGGQGAGRLPSSQAKPAGQGIGPRGEQKKPGAMGLIHWFSVQRPAATAATEPGAHCSGVVASQEKPAGQNIGGSEPPRQRKPLGQAEQAEVVAAMKPLKKGFLAPQKVPAAQLQGRHAAGELCPRAAE
jgi:hypothetical protein